jgi:hypothetical protein
MPDVTPAQLLAVITFAVAQAVAWGWVNNDTGQLVISIAGTVIAAAWKIADMFIRRARNQRKASEAIAKTGAAG